MAIKIVCPRAEFFMTDQTGLADPIQRAQMMQSALNAPVPRIYANGFMVGQTATDMSVVLLANAMPSGILHMSYGSAKSLVGDLLQAIKSFEEATKQPVLTIKEAGDAMNKAKGPGINVS